MVSQSGVGVKTELCDNHCQCTLITRRRDVYEIFLRQQEHRSTDRARDTQRLSTFLAETAAAPWDCEHHTARLTLH